MAVKTLTCISYWGGGKLAGLVASGEVEASRVEDMARRILASWFLLTGPDSDSLTPGAGLPIDFLAKHNLTEARDPASDATVKQGAVEGHVLVKNVNGALPLKKPKLMSIFGRDATIPLVNNPDGSTYNGYTFGFQSVNITSSQIIQAVVQDVNSTIPETGTLGTLVTGGGSGTAIPSYWFDVSYPVSLLYYANSSAILVYLSTSEAGPDRSFVGLTEHQASRLARQ